MSKKSVVARQAKRERLVQRNFQKRQELKKRIINPELSDEEREAARLQLNKMSPNTSSVRLKNRCQVTGRPRGFLRRFKLSRIVFREMASEGLIPGVSKASW